MRIMMLSANTGEGHNSTARAMMEVLKERNVECEMVDCLSYISPSVSKFIGTWHVRIYRMGFRLFDTGYRMMEHASNPEEMNICSEMLNLGAPKLRDALIEGKYDAVICVHPFSGSMLTTVRRNYGLKIPAFFVATDYTSCPTVEQCDLDWYFIPAKELTGEFMQSGLPRRNLLPYGIPVRQAFYSREPKETARESLGLPQDAVVALLMCGSMGCGPIQKVAENLVKKLPENAMVVAVCGSNQRLYKSMERIAGPRLRVLGFTRNIPEYMDAADMIITKPGGLSSTEAANKALPMVLINSVGGCENHNFDFFTHHGMALGSTKADEVVRCAVTMATDHEKRREISEKLSAAFRINSGVEIIDRVIKETNAFLKAKNEQESNKT